MACDDDRASRCRTLDPTPSLPHFGLGRSGTATLLDTASQLVSGTQIVQEVGGWVSLLSTRGPLLLQACFDKECFSMMDNPLSKFLVGLVWLIPNVWYGSGQS